MWSFSKEKDRKQDELNEKTSVYREVNYREIQSTENFFYVCYESIFTHQNVK